MKRPLVVLALFAFVFAASLAADTSEYYPVRVTVVKIYAHADGYRVLYRKGTADIAEVYIPARWFSSGGKAALIRGSEPSYPYLVVFYKEGKFDHLRLYALADTKDQSWGILDPALGKGKFDGEDIKLEF
jgi:hypothetical protein